MNIFFSSDFHFNHKNICGPNLTEWASGYRNFTSLDEMNNHIIGNLNEKVGEDDILYFLGDFAFGDKKQIPALRERINCRNIHLIYGNHDSVIRKTAEYRSVFNRTQDYLEFYHKKILFCLFHFPISSWNEMRNGAINVFGHCHGNFTPTGKQIDVGVDANNFYPVHIDDVIERMSNVTFVERDHH